MPKNKTAKPKGPTVTIELTEINKGAFTTAYELRIPGFGNPGCTVTARNATVAKKVVAEFVGNELMNAKELTS